MHEVRMFSIVLLMEMKTSFLMIESILVIVDLYKFVIDTFGIRNIGWKHLRLQQMEAAAANQLVKSSNACVNRPIN